MAFRYGKKDPKSAKHTDATALQATLLLEMLMNVLLDKGAKMVSPAKGQQVVDLMVWATGNTATASNTDAYTTVSVAHTWRHKGETHTATLRATSTVGAPEQGMRLTLADHTSY